MKFSDKYITGDNKMLDSIRLEFMCANSEKLKQPHDPLAIVDIRYPIAGRDIDTVIDIFEQNVFKHDAVNVVITGKGESF